MPTTVVHIKKAPFDIYIGRTGGDQDHFGNPFSHKIGTSASVTVHDRDTAILCFEKWLKGEIFKDLEQRRRSYILANLHILKDKVLGCWCKPLECHGDILAKMADSLEIEVETRTMQIIESPKIEWLL